MRLRCFFMLASMITCALAAQTPVDKNATIETKALLSNLKRISTSGFMFGHQDDAAYGVGWTSGEGRSDVKLVTGSYPAIHGWDLGKENTPTNLDGVPFSDIRRWIIATYERGGVNTISWHVDNPVSGGGSWDTTRAVKHILPGGAYHQQFLARLDSVADFLNSLQSGKTKVPVIWRPWHEHNGNWFWWGKGNCTEDEYIALFRFTVDYLRNVKKLHHLLYAFSPDRSRIDITNFRQSYLWGYPGDDYVDIIGYDNYMDVGAPWNKKSQEERIADLVTGLKGITALAEEKNKVAALTETGFESIPQPDWFTTILLNPIKTNPDIRIAWVLVWRNFDQKHHYAPYPGHPAVPDFITFYKDPVTYFESDLNGMYKPVKPVKPVEH
jgi:mannan endo-1,4-beta-mannosidase